MNHLGNIIKKHIYYINHDYILVLIHKNFYQHFNIMKLQNQLQILNHSTFLNFFLNNYKITYSKRKIKYTDIYNEEYNQDVIKFANKYNLDIIPYLYVLSLQTDKELHNFTKYFISYLVKSNILDNYNYINLFDLIIMDIEYMITCIICIQYYF